MLIIPFAICILATGFWGFQVLAGLGEGESGPAGLGAFDRLGGSCLVALLATLAVNWALSPVRGMRPGPLVLVAAGSSLAMAAVASARAKAWRGKADFLRAAFPTRTDYWESLGMRPGSLLALVILPVLVWVGYVLWRGTLIMPQSHDALAYHFPKAAFMLQGKGYAFFGGNDYRIACSGANYEVLLTDFMAFTGTDIGTAWISTATYSLLVIQAMGMAERWWGRGDHVLALGLLVAGMPISLLHSGAYKNDLLTMVFVLGSLHWTFRGTRESRPGLVILGVLACCAAVGTKANAALLIPGLALGLGLALARARHGGRMLALWAGAFGSGQLLLGGQVYLYNWANTGKFTGFNAVSANMPSPNNVVPFYGQWANLWMWPILVLKVPFSGNPMGVWVPWRHENWFWPRYEFYCAHWGALVSLLVLALPFALLGLRRSPLRRSLAAEALPVTLAALLFTLLLLPIGFKTLGFFAGYGRYVLFMPILIGLWTLGPFFVWLNASPGRRRWSYAMLVLLSVVFAVQAMEFGAYDRFEPWSFIGWAYDHDAPRHIFFNDHRAGSTVDRMAGPRDVVAFDGGVLDAWIYPAFGAGCTRKVVLLDSRAPEVVIPPEVDWVAIDRSWNIIWENHDLTDMGRFWRLINQGRPSADDLKVGLALSQDPHWRLVYYLPAENQAIFHRERPGTARPPAGL